MNKEIGGYIEFGGLIRNSYYDKNCLAFNSGRNCLRYLIRTKKIQKIFLPYFLCNSMRDASLKENVEIEFYHIKQDFTPDLNYELSDNEYVLIVNYYGILNNDQIATIKKQYINIIVDNTQSFFQKALTNIDTIYNCRKYFGVPDGAYLITDTTKNEISLQNSKSSDKIKHLLGRLEESADAYYADFQNSEQILGMEDIMHMSKITEILMGAIDYENSKKCREQNISYLHEKLKSFNKLKLDNIPNMSFMYPFFTENADLIRKKLIEKKIYVPILWPDVLENGEYNNIEHEYVSKIIPIPIDQRYNRQDMEHIINIISEHCNEKN